MLHHVSFTAKDPRRVAGVVAELIGGSVGRFGPWAGGYIAWAPDKAGTAVEIYPHGTEIGPDEGDSQARFGHNYFAQERTGTHAALSVDLGADEVLAIAEREGWRCLRLDRGGFDVLELWIENRVMFEVMTQDMLTSYLSVVDAPRIEGSGEGLNPISLSVVVKAAPDVVWRSWTEAEALRTWWPIPDARIDLRIDGAFELLFLAEETPGHRGSEGCRILSYVPEGMLSFTWNPPAHLGMRQAQTWIVLTFRAVDGGTEVELTQAGFGEGREWEACRQYFRLAWQRVLRRMSDHWSSADTGSAVSTVSLPNQATAEARTPESLFQSRP